MDEEKCRDCIHFRPHGLYPYFGYCSSHMTGTHELEACERFKRATLDELLSAIDRGGGVYCMTCRTTIVDKLELENHPRGHRVVVSIVFDEAVAEEAKPAD